MKPIGLAETVRQRRQHYLYVCVNFFTCDDVIDLDGIKQRKKREYYRLCGQLTSPKSGTVAYYAVGSNEQNAAGLD